jgi:cephalosporin hydroxylase
MSYQFTADYVTMHESNWKDHLTQFAGKPKVTVLEIGSSEGRSAVWFLENILTHDTSRITCVDLFFSEVFYNNLSKFARKITLLAGDSKAVLRDRQFLKPAYDIIYIDGDHGSATVLTDVILAFTALKVGGTLIFDDYQWKEQFEHIGPAINFSEDEILRLEPKLAIDSFINVFTDQFDLLHKGYQVIIRKKKPKITNEYYHNDQYDL